MQPNAIDSSEFLFINTHRLQIGGHGTTRYRRVVIYKHPLLEARSSKVLVLLTQIQVRLDKSSKLALLDGIECCNHALLTNELKRGTQAIGKTHATLVMKNHNLI